MCKQHFCELRRLYGDLHIALMHPSVRLRTERMEREGNNMMRRDESVENEMLIWLEPDLFLIRLDEELEEEHGRGVRGGAENAGHRLITIQIQH